MRKMRAGKIGPYTKSRIYTGDALHLGAAVPDNSLDMIFTDPPYLREYLPLYGWLAEFAARALKPGGFCLAMAGGLYADQIMAMMSKHLNFYWTLHVDLTGQHTGKVHPGGNHKPIITRVKPIYAFVKGWGQPRTVLYDPFSGSGNDKRFHYWGQDAQSARYYIDCFTHPGELICDPFSGGGTTAVVCKALKRQFLAFEIDPAAADLTRGRIRNPLFMPEHEAGQLRMNFVA